MGERRGGTGSTGKVPCGGLGAFVCWLLCWVVSCQPAPAPPRPLLLLGFQQESQRGVLLNETLLWHFSEEIDRTSITVESVRVRDERGEAVEGRLEVEGARLRFVPRAPLSTDLSDGSFRPGTTYQVTLIGFPRLDGVRARGGAPLGATRRSWFQTVRAGEGRRLFEDPSPGRSAPLELLRADLATDEPILLRREGPLDPTTIHADDFELRRIAAAGESESGLGALVRVPLRVRLVRNDPHQALLELRAIDPERRGEVRSLLPGNYRLWIDPRGARLEDFGGVRVAGAWAHLVGPGAEIRVQPRGSAEARASLSEDFLGASGRSPEGRPEWDGTAHWGDGRLRVRWPRAAGDGRDGRVRLEQWPEQSSGLSATHLELPADARVLLPERGLVLIRAQGAMHIDGTLERRTQGMPFTWREGEAPLVWLERLGRAGRTPELASIEYREGDDLSSWLAWAAERDEAWTVLVAGGDLTVRGELRSDGPVVLVAGGWVRLEGSVTGSEVHLSHPGGGPRVLPASKPLPFAIDEPRTNPLRQSLRVGAVSLPVRPAGGVGRWQSAQVIAHAGAGRWSVRFLGERLGPRRELESIGPVDDAALLEDAPVARFAAELEVPAGAAGEPWDPPFLDRIEWRWQPPARTGSDR